MSTNRTRPNLRWSPIAAGGQVSYSRAGHWLVRVDGKLVVTISASCSDRRAHWHVLAVLRRAGLDARVPR